MLKRSTTGRHASLLPHSRTEGRKKVPSDLRNPPSAGGNGREPHPSSSGCWEQQLLPGSFFLFFSGHVQVSSALERTVCIYGAHKRAVKFVFKANKRDLRHCRFIFPLECRRAAGAGAPLPVGLDKHSAQTNVDVLCSAAHPFFRPSRAAFWGPSGGSSHLNQGQKQQSASALSRHVRMRHR